MLDYCQTEVDILRQACLKFENCSCRASAIALKTNEETPVDGHIGSLRLGDDSLGVHELVQNQDC